MTTPTDTEKLAQALRPAFVTAQSCGPDSKYELVFKFRSLEALQAAHRAVIDFLAEIDCAHERAQPASVAGPVAWEYYYRVDECNAESAHDPDCICWHPEGGGPFKDAKHDESSPLLGWRRTPHPPEPADAATKALAALGHVRKPNERCTARYAEVSKEDRPPGPANVPVWCCLRAGHEGPHKCSHYGMHPPFVMRTDQTVMGDPLPDVCSKCGTRWPCPDAASVIAAMAQESNNG